MAECKPASFPALPAPPKEWKKGAKLIMRSVALPRKKRRLIECAGRGFQRMVDGEDYIDIELEEQKRMEAELKRRAMRQQKMKLPEIPDLDDYYALLGLGDMEMASTEEEIRNAYRRVSLTYHPDKAPSDQREEAERIYKAMQEAYDTLIDPARRRIYDSQRDFDDSIPGDSEGTGGEKETSSFFKVYDPVFKRNSHFSKKRPVPRLGNMDTPMKEVHSFYDFWLSFQSWREFKHSDEHRLEDAESREERRWMERENRKLVADQIKREKKRVRRLVNNAMKLDPRLLRAKRLAKEEKEAKKRAKREARLKREAERKAVEDAERAAEERKKVEAEKKRLEEKQAREAARKVRKRFRQLGKKELGFEKFDVDTVVERMKPVQLASFLEELQATSLEKAKDLLQRKLDTIAEEKKKMAEAREREAEERRAKARLDEALAQEAQRKRAVWSDIELMWLAKAIQKFPSGCHDRWGQVCRMVNLMAKNPPDKERTEKDVIKQARLMNQKKLQTGFSNAYNKKLKFSAGDGTVFEKPKGAASEKKSAGNSAEGKSAESKTKKKKGKRKKKSKDKLKEKSKEKSKETAGIKADKPSSEKKAADIEPEETNEWSAIQQQALEQALRSTPKGPERWDNIASKVPGKTKKDCIRRFKEIRAKIMAQRAAAAGK
mmetsp:Transcript_2027/g.2892  ORF Transcript_2027/g.2892 Transcript_2027/m.2892 type:complete len:662 (+) Transcript_2027:21-2006(+)